MPTATWKTVLDHLHKLAGVEGVRDLSDADLLDRFRSRREEAAFTLLMQRHGPTVLSVCRRVLGDDHEAEDAFQATFLVLVRKAGAIRKQQSLASFLYGVAQRIALKARAQSARRRAREQGANLPEADAEPVDTLTVRELRAALDEEIAQLPVKYRSPLVLCYLADKTHEQAARELGWPKSSVTARLSRARQLLHQRLTRRGFTLPAGLLAVLLAEQTATAVPALLTLSTVRLAQGVLHGETLTPAAVALADSIAKGTTALKLMAALTLVVTLGLAAAVGLRLSTGVQPPKQQEPAPPEQASAIRSEPKAEVPTPRVDLFGDPLPPGARARLGTVRLRQGGTIGQFAFAPDGKVLAAASNDNRVCLWEAATGRELRCLENATAGIDPGLAFSPDGKVLATGQDAEVRRWDTTLWSELPRWRLKSGMAGQLCFSPDGRTLACLGWEKWDNETRVNTVVFLDTSTGRERHRLKGRKNYRAPSVAFAPDSKTWAYVDCHDKTIGLFDIQTGKELRRFEGHSRGAWTVAFSPDGKTLASTDFDGTLRFWDTATGEQLPRRGLFCVANLTYSPDGKRLAGWRNGPGSLLYDIATGKEVLPSSEPRQGGEGPALLSPDGTRLAWAHDHSLHLWDAATLKSVRPATAHEREVWAVAFSPDGNTVVSAGGEFNFVRRWDAATGQALSPFRDVRDSVYALAYSPDGGTLAVGTGNHEGTIWLLDTATGKRLRTLVVPRDCVVSLAFSADGRTLLSGQGKAARLWDVATGKVLQTSQGGVFPTADRFIALSPDGRIIADNGGDNSSMIHLRQATTGGEVRTLPNQDHLSALAFSPDGKTLASGGFDQTVKLWDVATGMLLWQAKGRQGAGGVYFLTFSPDGKTLASDDGEGGVYLWEATTGKERHRFQGHRHGVRSGAFSRNGKLLATGSYDTTVLVWDLTTAAGTPRRSPLSVRNLDALWADLAGSDAVKAYQGVWTLAAAPKQAVPFLRQRVQPVPAPDRERFARLLADLNSAVFVVREKAAAELEKEAAAVEPLVRQALAGKLALEVRRRLEKVLDELEARSPNRLRLLRAVESLEHMDGAEAKRLLEGLADGAPEAWLTREAKAACARLREDALVVPGSSQKEDNEGPRR